jgi:hypothetical protein
MEFRRSKPEVEFNFSCRYFIDCIEVWREKVDGIKKKLNSCPMEIAWRWCVALD